MRLGQFDFDLVRRTVQLNGHGMIDRTTQFTYPEQVLLLGLITTKLNLVRFGWDEEAVDVFMDTVVDDLTSLWESEWLRKSWDSN